MSLDTAARVAERSAAGYFGTQQRADMSRANYVALLAKEIRQARADALLNAAVEWAADPDSWGDNVKDFRNELRDRAEQARLDSAHE